MEAEKLVSKLTFENYSTWRIQMRLLLQHKNLVTAILPEKRSESKFAGRSDKVKKEESLQQQQALTLIDLRVDDEFLTVIEDARIP
jgi:hypothetical protein